MAEEKKIDLYRMGVIVFVVLAVLTIIEFYAADLNSAVLMFLIALGKGALIVHYFMNISRLWREESH
ncbi:MAG: cytochrome C oxidase subunit IV family protein [Chloroflexota bacterium]